MQRMPQCRVAIIGQNHLLTTDFLELSNMC
jgi:hypothetical protein